MTKKIVLWCIFGVLMAALIATIWLTIYRDYHKTPQ